VTFRKEYQVNINGTYLSAVLPEKDWDLIFMLLLDVEDSSQDKEQAKAVYATIVRQLSPIPSSPDDFLNEDDMR
jgi:hypothetical protein